MVIKNKNVCFKTICTTLNIVSIFTHSLLPHTHTHTYTLEMDLSKSPGQAWQVSDAINGDEWQSKQSVCLL